MNPKMTLMGEQVIRVMNTMIKRVSYLNYKQLAGGRLSQGSTLLEVLFVIVILALAVLSLFNLFNLILKMNWENKARVGAIELANKKIEIVRNLPYDEIGTVGGVVAGNIPENEVVSLNGIEYNIYTNVAYVDDPFDGTWESDPVDTLTNDYKKILVRVSWNSNFSFSPIDLYTDVAPNGVETNLGGGTLAFNVFDANGIGIDDASIHIYNSQVVPNVDMTSYTNAQGQLVLPGVAAADSSYQITVTKSGYSTAQTYDTSVDLPSPDKPHLSVFEGQSTTASFAIDKLANMTIYVKDINDLSLGNIVLRVHGEKRKGLDGEGEPVYKFDNEENSGASGIIDLSNIEWDSYNISISTTSGYDINEISPPEPIELLPEETKSVTVKLEPTADHSLLVIVKDVNDQPLGNANVQVTNVLGYDKVSATSDAGQAFFTPLDNATTTVKVTKSGYSDYNNEIMVNGYTYEPVIMTTP